MKKLLKFLCGRIFITGLLRLLQAGWLGGFFWKRAASLGQDEAVFGALRGDDARAAARSRYITATGGYPVCMDSDVKYYPLGEEMYADMLRALESAEHFIFLEYFIIQPGKMWDGIAEILKRKAAQGVDVRLICDDMGSLFLLPQGFAREMERSGVKTLMFNPLYTGAFSGDEQPRPPQDHGRGRAHGVHGRR